MSVETTRLEDLGRELGAAIAETEEYQAYEDAKSAVANDPQAQETITEFEQLREQFMLARQTGTASQEDLMTLQETQQELHAIPTMEEFLEAQDELDDRLAEINEAISGELEIDFAGEAGSCCQD